jgi:hypothetical protein
MSVGTLALCFVLGSISSGVLMLTFFSATLGILRVLIRAFPEAIALNMSFSSSSKIGKGLETWLLSMLGRARRWNCLADVLGGFVVEAEEG